MRSTTIWKVTGLAMAGLTMVGLTVATVSANVPAHECGSDYESKNYLPAKQDITDSYFDITPNLIDDATVEKIRNFTDDLDRGKWKGTGLDIRCVSHDNTTVTSYDVDAKFDKHSLGTLVMKLEQETTDHSNVDEIYLSPETELDPTLEAGIENNTLGQRTGHRSFRVDLSSPETLVYDEKYRRFIPNPVTIPEGGGRPTPPFSVQLVHEIKTVSISQKDLIVLRDVYVNGKFYSQQQWQLERI